MGPEIASEIGIDPNLVLKRKKTKALGSVEDVDMDELDNIDDDFKRELRLYVLHAIHSVTRVVTTTLL